MPRAHAHWRDSRMGLQGVVRTWGLHRLVTKDNGCVGVWRAKENDKLWEGTHQGKLKGGGLSQGGLLGAQSPLRWLRGGLKAFLCLLLLNCRQFEITLRPKWHISGRHSLVPHIACSAPNPSVQLTLATHLDVHRGQRLWGLTGNPQRGWCLFPAGLVVLRATCLWERRSVSFFRWPSCSHNSGAPCPSQALSWDHFSAVVRNVMGFSRNWPEVT